MVSAEKEPERTLGPKRSRGASPNGHSDFSDDEREGGSSKIANNNLIFGNFIHPIAIEQDVGLSSSFEKLEG